MLRLLAYLNLHPEMEQYHGKLLVVEEPDSHSAIED